MRPARLLLVSTLIFAPPLAHPTAASAAPTAAMMANTCAMCHGTDGKAVGKMEKLYGMSSNELAEELFELKRENKGRIMAPLMKAYSDEQIRMIADHFGSLSRNKR